MLLYHCFHFCTSRWSFWYGLHLGVAIKHHTLYQYRTYFCNQYFYNPGLCAFSSNGRIATFVKFRLIRFRSLKLIICHFQTTWFSYSSLLFDCWFEGNIGNFVIKMHWDKNFLMQKVNHSNNLFLKVHLLWAEVKLLQGGRGWLTVLFISDIEIVSTYRYHLYPSQIGTSCWELDLNPVLAYHLAPRSLQNI